MIAAVPSPSGYSGAILQVDIDDAEHERRHAAGPGDGHRPRLRRPGRADGAPRGLPVPLAALIGHQRAYVLRAPAGICTVTGEQVTRHVTRPCRVTLATVRATSASKTALDSASRFAPFCARQVIITRAPSLRMPERLLEFGFYGIGVCLEHESGELETLVEPRPWRPNRHTAAGWWFAEIAYGQFLAQQPSTAAAQL